VEKIPQESTNQVSRCLASDKRHSIYGKNGIKSSATKKCAIKP
jgi:hypothetical protein